MKRTITLIAAVALATIGFAQTPADTISGNITSDMTLSNNTIHYLKGFVFVKNNATLTIEPGTIIKGKSGNFRSTLIITRGSKLIANGTAQQPIVFTSDQEPGDRSPADWGGVILLGKAIINRPSDCSTCPGAAVAANEPGIQNAIEGDVDNANGDGLYGGTDNNDNSGSLTYVRIEYGGIVITPNNEINGLTFGGVGKGTTIDHVQVSYSNDDSYEWFGGNVNCKHLISLGAIDDDFDTDFGYAGLQQFGVAQRDSNNYDTGNNPTTNGFESDNDGTGTLANPRTRAVFSNYTIVGPLAFGQPLQQSNSFNYGARLRRATQESIENSVIIGYPTGILLDGRRANTSYLGDSLILKNNIVAGALLTSGNCNIRSNDTTSGVFAADRIKFETDNDTLASASGILMAPFVYGTPDFFPKGGGGAEAGASFVDTTVSKPFFTQTTYKGAFGVNALGLNDHWDWCWSNWNPQNTDYDNAPINNPKTVVANFTYSGVQNVVTFTNTSTDGVEYAWSFGDGQFSTDPNPTHTYANNDASYTVAMIAIQPCGIDTVISQVNVAVGIKEYANVFGVTLFPNPAQDLATINFKNPTAENVNVQVYNTTGQMVSNINYGKLVAGKQNLLVNTSAYDNGVYFVRLNVGGQSQTMRIVVAK